MDDFKFQVSGIIPLEHDCCLPITSSKRASIGSAADARGAFLTTAGNGRTLRQTVR